MKSSSIIEEEEEVSLIMLLIYQVYRLAVAVSQSISEEEQA